MKSKKLLTLIIIAVLVVVLFVILGAVFTVKSGDLVFHSESGELIATPSDAPSANEVLTQFYGKNIIFLSKQDVLDKINAAYPKYHAIAVVKSFPNTITVHLVDRVAIFKVGNYYVDSFGYLIAEPSHSVIDVTSVFTNASDIANKTVGSKLVFNNNPENDLKLNLMLQAVGSVWQLNYAFEDIPKLIKTFKFGSSGEEKTLTIVTKTDVEIVVYSPSIELTSRLHNAFSVYYNDIVDATQSGIVIHVPLKGNVTTSGI